MGGAVCLRRRWRLASDDWIFCAPFIILPHILFIFFFLDQPIAVVVAGGCITLDFVLAVWSAQGSVTDIEGRRAHLPTFLGIRLVCNAGEMLGCCLLAHVSTTLVERAVAMIGAIVTAAVILSLPVLSDPLTVPTSQTVPRERMVPWFVRIPLRIFGAQTDHLATLGELLLKFGTIDMTVTDVLTGLLLTRLPPPPPGTLVSSTDPSLTFVRQFTPYSSLIYGWPVDMMIRFTSANTTLPTSTAVRYILTSLIRRLYRCNFWYASNPLITGDNFLGWHSGCVEKWINARKKSHGECELVRASFLSSIGTLESTQESTHGSPPWLIMDDHALKKTVVAVRGTMSVADAITDSMINLVPLGLGCVHEGFYYCAKNVLRDISDDIEHARYPLVFVGHSMGASVATICGLLLRERGINVQVLAVSPSGTTHTPELAETTRTFVTTVLVDTDWAPRLTVGSLVSLQSRIHQKLRTTSRSKFGIWVRSLCCHEVELDDISPLSSDCDHQPDTICPGRVIQLRPRRFSLLCCGLYSRQCEFSPYWIDPADLSEIAVTQKAMENHFLNIMLDALDSLPACAATLELYQGDIETGYDSTGS